MADRDSGPIREIRINPVIPGESVLIATARSMRPKQEPAAMSHDSRSFLETCPFCRGNESRTPSHILQIPETGEWDLRIVENLYPVLGNDKSNPDEVFGLQQTIDGYGRHEVVIDHFSHGIRLHEMSEEHLALLFATYRKRMEQLYNSDPRLRHILVFKNFGAAAGASIGHTHSQIIAMPVVPFNVQSELSHSLAFYRKSNTCIFCCLIDEAMTFEATVYDSDSGTVTRKIKPGQFMIERSKKFIVVKPFASRFEWEVQILPLSHSADFLDSGLETMTDLALIVKRTMTRLDTVLGGVQYNFFIHSLPHGPEFSGMKKSFHWHIEICPRTSIPTGFELGSGLFVNTIAPEVAAARLRDVVIS